MAWPIDVCKPQAVASKPLIGRPALGRPLSNALQPRKNLTSALAATTASRSPWPSPGAAITRKCIWCASSCSRLPAVWYSRRTSGPLQPYLLSECGVVAGGAGGGTDHEKQTHDQSTHVQEGPKICVQRFASLTPNQHTLKTTASTRLGQVPRGALSTQQLT